MGKGDGDHIWAGSMGEVPPPGAGGSGAESFV